MELDFIVDTPVTIHEDNKGTIQLSTNQLISGRSKHIQVRYHYIRDEVDHRRIHLEYCPTKDMTADALTKPLPYEVFKKMRHALGIREDTFANEGKC